LKMKKLFIFLVFFSVSNVFAYTTKNPIQYSDLQWSVTGTTGLEPTAYCTSLTLNGVTDFTTNSIINFSGILNCNAGNNAYVVNGSGYLNNSGGISLGLTISGMFFWNCQTNGALFANCKAMNTSGVTIGYPTISFK
jgi:hypothetical protein